MRLFHKKFQLRLVHLFFVSIVPVALLVLKFLLYRNAYLAFMLWNLFLAWMPVFFALLYARTVSNKDLKPAIAFLAQGGTFLGWLLFLPNAPYLLTDLIHPFRFFIDYHGLRQPPIHDSLFMYEIIMISIFALVGFLLTFVSMDVIMKAIKKRVFLGKNHDRIFVLLIGLLNGLGIYIGRFLRFNSWDVVTNPIQLIVETFQIFTTVESLQMFAFVTLGFTFLLYGGFALYRSLFEFEAS